jgi:hypothetical protein
MPKHRSTNYDKCLVAAQCTIDLVNHRQMPDRISEAVLETLIEMSGESKMQIWHEKTGLHLETLASLYALHKRGAGYRRVRLYGRYEAARLVREAKKRKVKSVLAASR